MLLRAEAVQHGIFTWPAATAWTSGSFNVRELLVNEKEMEMEMEMDENSG